MEEPAGAGLCSLGRRFLRNAARSLKRRRWWYVRVGQEPEKEGVPVGHLAVYVGEAEGAACRAVVPVVYFNHPLFASLLKQAETVYGFDQPGGIRIPCRVSEFESVKSRIAAAADGLRRS
ncbi:unnamed protein product [Cuscuta campestris]|uniref:Auxin-responsive protein n=2 Tax=Cuscuta sect. Cleistogrammica TaxID=1824901 RepID=A0A484L386_9ASTE|nr:hypothetical protein DM860_001806 [Cuscuta australis]VFQ70758.1 unnamed protein product [Cuscuta campestris]